jgi:hypothetical protein
MQRKEYHDANNFLGELQEGIETLAAGKTEVQQNHELSMIASLMHTIIDQPYQHWNYNYKINKMKVTLTPIK